MKRGEKDVYESVGRSEAMSPRRDGIDDGAGKGRSWEGDATPANGLHSPLEKRVVIEHLQGDEL
ncbi:hypothetical protein EYF80_023113 [Liparis tanakae]|uniref:Uncharacterized protein n=1 Tax=Liparis tanakae TaxID=230148 RepID=A0A4Z2HP32_9TELE|nr:hypothetical protein EYF80_023113 [Liparis tanakae]